MTLPIVISILAVIVSIISVAAMIYFNSKNSKHTDIKDIERQVAERTEVNLKLDTINQNTQEIRYDVSAVKKDVQKHTEKIIELEQSARSAHHRIDGLEDRLNAREVQE